jgi:colanic acid/amylovoran biosynthesis glycosyltransferase
MSLSAPDNQRLRVLFAGLTWPPETFLARLIQSLADHNIEVTLATAQKPEELAGLGNELQWLFAPTWGTGGKLSRLAWLATLSARALFGGLSDCRNMAERIRREKNLNQQLRAWYRHLPFAGRRWDLIYFPWNSGAIAYLPLFDLNIPVLLSCRGTQINVTPHNPARADFLQDLKTTFSRAAAVHCVSEAICNEAAALGLAKAKAVVIRPAVDPQDFRPATQACQRTTTGLQILSIGRLSWGKGFEYALLAVRELAQAGVELQFEIIGEGPERKRLEYAINDLGLARQAKLLGQLPPASVLARLQQADVFLSTSLSEGISNAALEAMSCGVPVVTSDCGGMREAVNDGVEGFVVPVRNVQATATALLKLARDAALRRGLGAAARARVLNEFTLPRQAAEFAALCRRVARQTA